MSSRAIEQSESHEANASKAQKLNSSTAQRLLIALAIALPLLACNHQTPVAAPPPIVPPPPPVAPPPPPPPVLTLDQVRALKQNVASYDAALLTLTQSSDPVVKRRATALLGLSYMDQKRTADAIATLQSAADLDPLAAPWLRLRVADLDRQSGDLGAAIVALTHIVQETPANSAATIARLRLPALYAATKDAALTDETFRDTNAIAIDELTENEFVTLAKALADAGRTDLANALRMRLLTQNPQGRFTEQIYRLLRTATPSPLDALPYADALHLANALAAHDHYTEALEMLQQIRTTHPSAETDTAYRSARIHALFHSRRYTDLLNETARERLDPQLALLRARAAWRSGHNDVFLAGLKQIIRANPDSDIAGQAYVLRSKFYTSDQPNYDQAIDDLQHALDNGVVGNEGENLWTLGWTYYLQHDTDDALKTFARYQQRFPDGDYLSNSLFWSGKIYNAQGKTAQRDAKFHELESLYPYSYFSYRAKEVAGEPATAPSDVPNGNVFPDVNALIASVSDPRLDSVRELAAIDLCRDATREMKILAAAYPDNAGLSFMLADLDLQGGEPFKADGVLQRKFRQFIRHGGTNVPHRFWEILYPLNYWDTIKSEAATRQLDPYLIASIIRQESGFEPTEVSNAGAVGIMQIMPEEAGRIATDAGLATPTREQLFDPRINIAIGAAEFSQKLARMHGNPILAIAAYNAGEDAVGRWLAQTPIDDIDLFVEAIPYAETRLYVKTVSRNRFEYRRIYEGVSSSLQPEAAPH